MKLLIIGNGGTGKSTLADRLGKELGFPAIHLDTLGFGKNWVRVDENEFKKKLSSILAGNDWIIDGWSYQSTMKTRIEGAEIIVYLKFNIWFCYWNALKRHIQYAFKYNPYDPPESWIWRKTIRMVKAMWRVYTVYEPEIKPWLDEYRDKKEIYIFKRRKDLNIFIEKFINLNKK